MSYIDEIFERCDFEQISSFILYGDGILEYQGTDYYKRSKAAYEKLHQWIKALFPDDEKYDEQCNYIHTIIGEIEEIYMQIGLQAGMTVAANFYKNNKHNKEQYR